MMDKQTSDERLLKLIEGSTDPAKHRQTVISAPSKGMPGLKPIKFDMAQAKTFIKNIKIGLFTINKALIGISALLIVLFFYVLASGPAVSNSNAAYFVDSDAASIAKLVSAKATQNLSRKIFPIQELKRNIFLVFGSKAAATEQGPAQAQNPLLAETVKDLKLVGIIWSNSPEVMIENSKDARTYTLKKGDSLNEQCKVKEISRNSATLQMNTDSGVQEYEIR